MFTETEGYNLATAKPWVLKMLAKRIKKNSDLKHSQILDELSKHAGFKCWNTYCAFWKDQECDGNR